MWHLAAFCSLFAGVFALFAGVADAFCCISLTMFAARRLASTLRCRYQAAGTARQLHISPACLELRVLSRESRLSPQDNVEVNRLLAEDEDGKLIIYELRPSPEALATLGKACFVDLPPSDMIVTARRVLAMAENAAGTRVMFQSPVDGDVMAVNSTLVKEPQLLHSAPEGWIARVMPFVAWNDTDPYWDVLEATPPSE